MSYLEKRRKFIEDGRPLPEKKKYVIPKKSAKRAQKEQEQRLAQSDQKKSSLPTVFTPSTEMLNDANDVVKKEKQFEGKGELGKWFMDRRLEMKNVCQHCGGKTMKDDNAKFHYSVCHILPKSLFPSVATHKYNFIELCYYDKSCHKNYDDGTIDISELNCFGIVIERVAAMYPFIAKEERRKLPPVLVEYLKSEL